MGGADRLARVCQRHLHLIHARAREQAIGAQILERVGAEPRGHRRATGRVRAAALEIVGEQLLARRKVHAVKARTDHWWRRDAKVHLARAGVAHHLDELLGRGAAHDRVVDEHHDAVGEHAPHRVELAAHLQRKKGKGR